MDSYGECPTAQQELDELELGRRPSHDLRFGQYVFVPRGGWMTVSSERRLI